MLDSWQFRFIGLKRRVMVSVVGIKDKTINQHPRDVAMRADAAEVGCDESRI